MTLGDIIKKYREDNNISMGEFANNCSLSKGYISMLENNINPRNQKPISPTLPSIAKVANGMKIDLDTLLKMMDNEQTIDLTSDKPRLYCESQDESKLLLSYRELTIDNKKKSIIYTKNLLSNQQMEKEAELLAAHARTTIEATEDGLKQDLDIMNNDDMWK